MAYCRTCGAEISDYAAVCPNCGTPVTRISDTGNVGWAALGFFFPLIGLILFLVWADSHPENARMAGMGALTAVLLPIGLGFLVFLIGLLLAVLL